ncbi:MULTISPECIES: hypothetical protein [Asticcacaulis]|uniref:hypothetical protein n=1 Tax=Asticcacaulis TaxID=76890 RepID=UPI001AEB5A46|nr:MULTISPECIES: hypothetical protein [Asticcacaulis]MBP2161176.1 hypothetical protein [Asticcacaulis solisilvae]MDR6802221.1 hypothetical protein [Asticcacaulis sp. BE141]
MPSTGSDKALRRLVAELAATTPEDMAAVLGMLDPKAAAQVRSLLAAYGGVADVFDVEAAPQAMNTAGLSDWLAARTLNQQMDGAGAYHMTREAIAALRQLTLSLPAELAHPQGRTAVTTGRQDTTNARLRTLFGDGT